MLEHTSGRKHPCFLVFLIVGICMCLWSSAAFAASTTGVSSATEEHTQEEWAALRESPKVPQVTLPEVTGEHSETPKVTSPEAPAAGTTGADGLNPGEPVPQWANHALIHFYPPIRQTSTVGGASGVKNASLNVQPALAGSGSQKLTYHGGYVQREPRLYLLFWGSNFWEGQEPPGLGGELEFFFRGLEKESIVNPAWQGILSQYWSYGGEAYKHAKVVAEARVSAVVAPTKVTNAKVEEEVGEWLENGATITPNTQFVVMLAPHSTFGEKPTGCAYHEIGEHDGQRYVLDVVPYAGDINKYFGEDVCNRLTRLKTTENEELMWSTTGAASHEFAEATTDPFIFIGEYPYTGLFGWVESESKYSETEIADLCIDEEEAKRENAIEELPKKNGRVGWTWVNRLWDDEGGNKCKLEDPPYSEPGAPGATTGGVSTVRLTEATLDGTVSPTGPASHYYFEYGLTTSYGSYAPSHEGTALPGGTEPDAVSAKLTGLSPDNTYHYRLVVSSADGTSYGADKVFTTIHTPSDLLADAVFAESSGECGAPTGWFLEANGGSENACAYSKASEAQEGSTFEEFNGSVSGASIGQNIDVAPQSGQSYTFSTWARAPEGEAEGWVQIFALKGSQVIDTATTTMHLTKNWQQVQVPLTMTQGGAEDVRVQVYEANHTIALDGTQVLSNYLANPVFSESAGECGIPTGWFMAANGGSENACAYSKASEAQEGSTFEEFNGSVTGASIGQDIDVTPQPGQSYTFSTWARAPEGAAEGWLQIYGLKSGEVIGDTTTTTFHLTKTWQQIQVPLTVTQSGEQEVRVQVYGSDANDTIALDGTQMLSNYLTNAVFSETAGECGTPTGWFMAANGGSENACAYSKASEAQEGSTFEEFNGSVWGASIGQNIPLTLEHGQTHILTAWVRTPAGEAEGWLQIYGLKSGEIIGDTTTTTFHATKTWQQIQVPLTTTQTGEQEIRVQIYESDANATVAIDGTELH